MDDLEQHAGLRHVLITVTDEGELELDSAGLSPWEELGIAGWYMSYAEQRIQDEMEAESDG